MYVGGTPARAAWPVFILLFVVHAAPAARAGEAPSIGESEAALDREIGALKEVIESLSQEQSSLSGELQTLEAQEALSRREAVRAVLLRDSVAREVSAAERKCEELRQASETGRVRARGALREAYKQSTMSGYGSLLAVSEPSDLLRGFQHLGIVARRQGEAVSQFERQRADLEESVERLRERKSRLDGAVTEASREQERLGHVRGARLEFLDRIKRDQALQQDALAELGRAAEGLAEAIRSLPEDRPSPKISIHFDRLRGALPWPADGSVSVPFGSVRHPRFGTMTPHPGIELRVKGGAPVRAVGAGRVIFSRRYGSFGRTVVIDHGERYLSVYAALAASMVSENDDVVPGQEIGFAGEVDGGGYSSVYFEIRYQGRAVDPQAWLRRETGVAGVRR